VFVRHAKGRVRCVVGDVAEKGPRLVFLDERQRMIREIIGHEALAAGEPVIVLQWRIEILAPVTGRETVVFLETARVRMVGPLAAIVPFAKGTRRVTGRLEGLGNGALVEVEPLLP